MDHLKFGWETVSQNLVGWIIFGLVFGVVVSFSGGLGGVLMPNAIRATRKAIAAGAAPEVGEMFVFDTIVDDAIAVIGQSFAIFLGSLACGVGALAAAPLVLFAPHIVSEGHYDGVGSLKVAVEHGKANLVGNLVQMLIIGIVLSLLSSFTFGLGAIIGMPVALVALEHFYQSVRQDVFSAAQAAQIPTKG